jgi:hypothetical protein
MRGREEGERSRERGKGEAGVGRRDRNPEK